MGLDLKYCLMKEKWRGKHTTEKLTVEREKGRFITEACLMKNADGSGSAVSAVYLGEYRESYVFE